MTTATTPEKLDSIFANDAEWDRFTRANADLATVQPVSPGYPQDGTCPACGHNRWGLWSGIPLCTNCGTLDP